jgi:hypothetical protein
MKKSGHADLPLHYGRVPEWLAQRMSTLGGAILETIVSEYGKKELIHKFSDPFWFQSLGAVLGMDWHSSGITTSVMGALKKATKPIAAEMGIYICGGRGKQSRNTPNELRKISDQKGLNGDELINSSKLIAKIDNSAVQDGFQIYLHSFIVSDEGDWAVVQQGMNTNSGYARRYHWSNLEMNSFVKNPHTFVCGENQGKILNLVHQDATKTQEGLLEISHEHPEKMTREIKKLILPAHHDVRLENIDLTRLGAVLFQAYETEVTGFEDLLLIPGLGPRTLQSLTLVSEVIHGTPSRFDDPARFSFAHGGKDGHPFPVPTKVYDQTIAVLKKSIERSKLGLSDKNDALKRLHKAAARMEENFQPDPSKFKQVIEKEWKNKEHYGGRTVFDDKRKKSSQRKKNSSNQLSLFD